jgi:hypothetical protein
MEFVSAVKARFVVVALVVVAFVAINFEKVLVPEKALLSPSKVEEAAEVIEVQPKAPVPL